MINVILIEDEQPALEILRSYLQDIAKWEITGEFDNPVDALSFMNQNHVDVIFLDIQLPRLTGIEFLKTLKNPPLVIITSAFSEHAVEAFELVVFDYLLKPFDFHRFLKTINRANVIFSSQRDEGYRTTSAGEYIYLNVHRKKTRIKLANIFYVESKKEYIHVVTKSDVVRAKKSLSAVCELLPTSFLRIHRSYVVNLSHVKAYSKSVADISGTELPIGEHYSAHALDILKKMFEGMD